MQWFLTQYLNVIYEGNLSVSPSLSQLVSQSVWQSVSIVYLSQSFNLSINPSVHLSYYSSIQWNYITIMELCNGIIITLQYQYISIIYLCVSVSHSIIYLSVSVIQSLWLSILPSVYLCLSSYPSRVIMLQ